MRLYSFVNYYLSPLQHGLQTAHCVSEMANEVAEHKGEDLESYHLFFDWADHHKTIIICNGGNSEMLQNLYAQLHTLAREEFGLPIVKFHEDEQSLNGALTSVAVLIPEEFYNAKYTEFLVGSLPVKYYIHTLDDLDADRTVITEYAEDSPEYRLITLLKSFRLA